MPIKQPILHRSLNDRPFRRALSEYFLQYLKFYQNSIKYDPYLVIPDTIFSLGQLTSQPTFLLNPLILETITTEDNRILTEQRCELQGTVFENLHRLKHMIAVIILKKVLTNSCKFWSAFDIFNICYGLHYGTIEFGVVADLFVRRRRRRCVHITSALVRRTETAEKLIYCTICFRNHSKNRSNHQ